MGVREKAMLGRVWTSACMPGDSWTDGNKHGHWKAESGQQTLKGARYYPVDGAIFQ